MKKSIAICALSFAALVSLFGRAMLQEREITLRFKFTANQIRTYEARMNSEMKMQLLGYEVPPITMSTEGTMSQTEHITSVDKEGIATLSVTVKGRLKMETFGLPAGTEGKIPSEQEIPTMQLMLKVNPLGKVVEMKMKQQSETTQQINPPNAYPTVSTSFLPQMQSGSWQGLLLPEKPVRIGDSWDITTTIDLAMRERTAKVEIKGRARLISFEKVDGRECAVIETETEIPDIGELMSSVPFPAESTQAEVQSESKIWLDINDGLVVRSETKSRVTIDFAIPVPTGEKINMTIQGAFNQSQRLIKIAQAKPEGQ